MKYEYFELLQYFTEFAKIPDELLAFAVAEAKRTSPSVIPETLVKGCLKPEVLQTLLQALKHQSNSFVKFLQNDYVFDQLYRHSTIDRTTTDHAVICVLESIADNAQLVQGLIDYEWAFCDSLQPFQSNSRKLLQYVLERGLFGQSLVQRFDHTVQALESGFELSVFSSIDFFTTHFQIVDQDDDIGYLEKASLLPEDHYFLKLTKVNRLLLAFDFLSTDARLDDRQSLIVRLLNNDSWLSRLELVLETDIDYTFQSVDALTDWLTKPERRSTLHI